MTATKWPEVALGDVCELRSGIGFPLHLQGRSAGKYPFAKVGDISRSARCGSRILLRPANFVDDTDLSKLKGRVFPAGTVAFAKIGEAIRQNHRVSLDQPGLLDNNAMGAIADESVIDVGYLYRVLQAIDLYPLASSTTVPSLRKSVLADLPVVLPPIEEQRRLAAVLDAADALSAKRRESLALLDSFNDAVFRDMFGHSQWPEVPMSEIVDRFEAGKSVDTNDGDELAARYRVLKVSAVTSGRFKPDESKPVPLAYVPPVDHFVRQGDLLFSRANTEALVGATALVDAAPTDVLLSDKLWRFVWRDSRAVRPLYVWKFLQLPATRHAIGRLATGTSGSMKNVSQAKLMGLPIPLPPTEVQQEFETRWRRVASTARQLGSSTEALDSLFASLQQRAFRGDL